MKKEKRLEYQNVLVALLLNHLGKEETGRVEQLWKVSNSFVDRILSKNLFKWTGLEDRLTGRRAIHHNKLSQALELHIFLFK